MPHAVSHAAFSTQSASGVCVERYRKPILDFTPASRRLVVSLCSAVLVTVIRKFIDAEPHSSGNVISYQARRLQLGSRGHSKLA